MSKVKIEGNASGTGTLTISAPNTNTDRSLTLPDKAGEIVCGEGSVLQVVQGSTTTRISATSSYVDTGLSASITPSSTSSKILIIVQQQGCKCAGMNTGDINIKLQRGTTDIYKFALGYWYSQTTNEFRGGISGTYLDSPSTTSSTTYKTVFKANDGGTSYVQNDSVNTVSTITLMEIAG